MLDLGAYTIPFMHLVAEVGQYVLPALVILVPIVWVCALFMALNTEENHDT